jgi:uncharacterized protein YhhL (DUF1145 family)
LFKSLMLALTNLLRLLSHKLQLIMLISTIKDTQQEALQ